MIESRLELAWRMSVDAYYGGDVVDAYTDPLLEGVASLPERVRRRLAALRLAATIMGAGGGIDPFATASAVARETCALADQILAEWRVAELQSMPYVDYLQTPEWRARREPVLERAAHRCQVCNSDGPLEVHHRTV